MINEDIRKALRKGFTSGIRKIGRYASTNYMLQSGMRRGRGRAKSHPTMLSWRTGKLGRSLRDIGHNANSYLKFTDTPTGVTVRFGTLVRYGAVHENPTGWTHSSGRHIQPRQFLRPAYYKFLNEGGFSFNKGVEFRGVYKYLKIAYEKTIFTAISQKIGK